MSIPHRDAVSCDLFQNTTPSSYASTHEEQLLAMSVDELKAIAVELKDAQQL